MTQLLSALRSATQEMHEALHVHPLLAPLQDAHITTDDYIACLRAFYAAHVQMEEALYYKLGTALPTVQWLEKDMQVHGITPVVLPVMDYPVIDNYSKYIGYLYVAQGSTLGGRVISKHLHRILGLIEGQTNHFFAGFGEETGARWKAFLSLLEDSQIDTHQAVEQAVQTFLLIQHYCDAAVALKKSDGYSAACG